MSAVFADTSALLAFLNGDESVARRFSSSPPRTGLLNVLEAVAGQVAVGLALEEALRNVAPFEGDALPPTIAHVREAARLIEARRGQALPLAAAVALAQARALGLPLLSGEASLRGLPGVEVLKTRRG